MIKITNNLQLQPILVSDFENLQTLMSQVYSLAYHYFWEDKGKWYVGLQYSKETIEKEITNKNAEYYFIIFNNEIIGNFRIIWDEKLADLPFEKQVKLHRLYLHPNTQGNGIGKRLVFWLKEKAIKKGYQVVWLDAMNQKAQAFEFYKKLGFQYFSECSLDFDLLRKEFRKMSQLYLKTT